MTDTRDGRTFPDAQEIERLRARLATEANLAREWKAEFERLEAENGELRRQVEAFRAAVSWRPPWLRGTTE